MPGRTDEYLYWLGFLLGDGSVTQHPNGTWKLRLSLSATDTEPALERKRTPALERAGWSMKKTLTTPLEKYA